METESIPYEKQIFVCTNNLNGEKPSCGDQEGEKIFKELRRIAKDRGLHPRIRIAQAKCLGKCGQGGNVMVYPDNVWYKAVTIDDIQAISEKFLSV